MMQSSRESNSPVSIKSNSNVQRWRTRYTYSGDKGRSKMTKHRKIHLHAEDWQTRFCIYGRFARLTRPERTFAGDRPRYVVAILGSEHSVSAQNVSHASYAALTPIGFEGWAVLATASDVYWPIKSLYLQNAVRLCLCCRIADFWHGNRAESTDSHRYSYLLLNRDASRMSPSLLMTEQGVAKGFTEHKFAVLPLHSRRVRSQLFFVSPVNTTLYS